MWEPATVDFQFARIFSYANLTFVRNVPSNKFQIAPQLMGPINAIKHRASRPPIPIRYTTGKMRRLSRILEPRRLLGPRRLPTLYTRHLFSFTSPEESRPKDLDELTLEEVTQLIELEEAEREEDEDEDDDSRPWQILLGPAARAAWRTSEQSPPQHWIDRRHHIVSQSELTSKQMKRNHQKIMNTHKALTGRRERERRREKQHRKAKPDSLQEKYENVRDSAATSVYYKPDFTFSTLHHRLLPNVAIMKRVLVEAQALLPDFHPKRILDFGIGVGSSSAAAIDVFDGIEWIHGVDPSKSMRECAEQVLENSGPRVTTDASLSTKSVKGNFDLVLFAFTATDLPHSAATMAAAAVLWEKLAPNGVFVMVEPGTPDGFSNIRSVRSMLLDCCPPEDDEDEELVLDQCHIIAPCTHNCECPMERHKRKVWPDKAEGVAEKDLEEGEDEEIEEAEFTEEDEDARFAGMTETDSFETSFCSFAHNIPGSPNMQKGDKLSYLVAQKRYPSSETTTKPPFPNITELLAETYRSSNDRDPINHEIMMYEAQQAKQKFEAMEEDDPLGLAILVGDKNRQSFGRIIRAPLKRKGHILVDYCASGDENKGRIVRHRIGKAGSSKIAPGQYAAARKARWGGLWPDIIDKIH